MIAKSRITNPIMKLTKLNSIPPRTNLGVDKKDHITLKIVKNVVAEEVKSVMVLSPYQSDNSDNNNNQNKRT